jgi:putative FmdB family regulatory protein
MPIYEYQCSACGHQLEVIQKMSDQPLTECPECHQPNLTKLVSAAGFQLKGTGWYVTDYSAKGKAKSANEAESVSPSHATAAADSQSTGTQSTDTTTKPAADSVKSSSSDSGVKS